MSLSKQAFGQVDYIGRFAPSPTGALHLGSLFTAVASYLDARFHRGKWLLRIDDADTPRNKPEAISEILKCLETFGLWWDGDIAYQSQNLKSYDFYLTKLTENQATYRCACSRKKLAEQSISSDSVYQGICRHRHINEDIPSAIRLKTYPEIITFQDQLQGSISVNIATQQGDFILKRKDGFIAYQFAVVIDDRLQGVTRIVRGCDLLVETPKQIYLHKKLGLQMPHYMHVPILIDKSGNKLSKQTLATAVNLEKPRETLFKLLVMLQQNPPNEIKELAVSEQLAWAIENWRPDRLNLCSKISV